MNWLLDSHIHLSDPEYDSDIPYIIKCMEKMHIKACCVSEDLLSSKKTIDLSKKTELIFPFVGIHPGKADEKLEPILELINQNIGGIAGIGEIGLDSTYVSSESEFQRQEQLFRGQLAIAEKIQKPISIHSRKTLDKIYEIIPSYSLRGMVLHWFDGSKQQLTKAMDLGFFVSFGPLLVYAKDKQVLLSKTEINRILVETDGPVKFSRCFALKPAQVSFIPSIIFCASKVLRKSYDEFSAILEKNSNDFLGI
ncbi:MAG: TatD-related deoxyribonuclease [Thaumarchaeota archaeon CSP1-1]|nr:MAG: TatD-related deoxyribonuclease [Thaumarchaeota archaeon CSP1-1]